MGESSDRSPFPDRIRHWARHHASVRSPAGRHEDPPSTSNASHDTSHNAARPAPSGSSASSAHANGAADGAGSVEDTGGDSASAALPPSSAPLPHTSFAGEKPSTLGTNEKPGWSTRIRAGSKRFVNHTKEAIFHSWLNVLLVFVPIGIAVNWVPMSHTTHPTVVFALNAVAIIPLAGLLSHATESVASRMGDTWASLLNVTFGNAVELIIFIIALTKNEIRIVQASILGSILSNLLLILGMAFLLGGLRYREQIYNSTITQMSACLLSLSVMSLLLPTAFHASFASSEVADRNTTKISRGTSVVLLLVYVLYLLFQLKSHAYMYESTPQRIIDEESHPGVLADILNSTDSSSSSSDSDTDSDSSSSTRNTAAKRIRKAFKNRRRRKSSASSITGNHSVISSPISSPIGAHSIIEDTTSTPPNGVHFDNGNAQRRGSVLDAVVNGDEIDPNSQKLHSQTTFVRDFELEHTEPIKVTRKQKKERRHRKTLKHQKEQEDPEKHAEIREEYEMPEETIARQIIAESGTEELKATSKRPFGRRQLSRPNIPRPPFPSLLSNNVFSMPPPEDVSHIQPASMLLAKRAYLHGIENDPPIRKLEPKLRRTSSLPDRLNRPVSAPNGSTIRETKPVSFVEPENLRKVESRDKQPHMSRTAAVVLLLCSTGLVAFCAELLVDAIPDMVENSAVSEAFIGLIVLPIVGNAAEHVTAVMVAAKNKMDLAIGVAVGSSIQIALFVTPFVVLLGWCLGKDMSLYFNLFETVSLFATCFVVNFLVLDGRSNYLEGSLLIAAYVIIAVAAFFYPNEQDQSLLGGSPEQVDQQMGMIRMLLA